MIHCTQIQDARGKWYTVNALVDCGATSTFISPRLVKKLGLSTVRAGVSTLGIDGTILANIKSCQKVEKIRVRYFDYLTPVDELEVLVVPMSAYDLILGIPWFNARNPEIDWKRKRVLAIRTPEGTDHPGDPVPAIQMVSPTTLSKELLSGKAEAFAIRVMQNAGSTYYRDSQRIDGNIETGGTDSQRIDGKIETGGTDSQRIDGNIETGGTDSQRIDGNIETGGSDRQRLVSGGTGQTTETPSVDPKKPCNEQISQDSLPMDRVFDKGRVTYVYGSIRQPVVDSTVETDDGSKIPAI